MASSSSTSTVSFSVSLGLTRGVFGIFVLSCMLLTLCTSVTSSISCSISSISMFSIATSSPGMLIGCDMASSISLEFCIWSSRSCLTTSTSSAFLTGLFSFHFLNAVDEDLKAARRAVFVSVASMVSICDSSAHIVLKTFACCAISRLRFSKHVVAALLSPLFACARICSACVFICSSILFCFFSSSCTDFWIFCVASNILSDACIAFCFAGFILRKKSVQNMLIISVHGFMCVCISTEAIYMSFLFFLLNSLRWKKVILKTNTLFAMNTSKK